MGQAAYLSKHHEIDERHFNFYVSVPGKWYSLFFIWEKVHDGGFVG